MKILKRCTICKKDKPRSKFHQLTKTKPKKREQTHINYGICRQCQEEKIKNGEANRNEIGNVRSGGRAFKGKK